MLAIDIDDTLTATALRVIERVHQLFGHAQSVAELHNKFLQPGNVPQWQGVEVKNEIINILESSEFLFELDPKPGSANLLHKVNKSYPISCYITSRSNVFQEITQAWLTKHHFPQASLVTRPISEKRQDWKLRYIREHFPKTTFLVDDVMVPEIQYFPEIQLLWLSSNQNQVKVLPKNVVILKSLAGLSNTLTLLTKGASLVT